MTVSETGSSQLLHPDSKILKLFGSGFNPYQTTLQFKAGGFSEYRISSMTETIIIVDLANRFYSQMNRNLTLLAVDVGAGFVSLNNGKGVHVATIIPKPVILSSSTKVSFTQKRLYVSGADFPPLRSTTPQFRFQPPLQEGKDYTLRAIDKDHFELTLSEGRAWAPYPTSLFIVGINVLGDDTGWFQSSEKVAEVVDEDPSLEKLDQISRSLSKMEEMWSSRFAKLESSASSCDEAKIVEEMKEWVNKKLVTVRKETTVESEDILNELLEEMKRVVREELGSTNK